MKSDEKKKKKKKKSQERKKEIQINNRCFILGKQVNG